jgi:hypothetical protein
MIFAVNLHIGHDAAAIPYYKIDPVRFSLLVLGLYNYKHHLEDQDHD